MGKRLLFYIFSCLVVILGAGGFYFLFWNSVIKDDSFPFHYYFLGITAVAYVVFNLLKKIFGSEYTDFKNITINPVFSYSFLFILLGGGLYILFFGMPQKSFLIYVLGLLFVAIIIWSCFKFGNKSINKK